MKAMHPKLKGAVQLLVFLALPFLLSASPVPGEKDPADLKAVLLDPKHSFWTNAAPNEFRLKFETTKGDFVIEVHRDWAPIGVDRLYNLVRAGFYDDSRFYRVNAGYIVQFGVAGEPAVAKAWRNQAMPDDPPRQSNNVRGTVAFSALTNANSRTTQIYINLGDNTRNDPQRFALFGKVVEGMDVVDQLYSGYGENSGGGMRAGRQEKLFTEGNAWLDRDFPNLDKLTRAKIDPPPAQK